MGSLLEDILRGSSFPAGQRPEASDRVSCFFPEADVPVNWAEQEERLGGSTPWGGESGFLGTKWSGRRGVSKTERAGQSALRPRSGRNQCWMLSIWHLDEAGERKATFFPLLTGLAVG